MLGFSAAQELVPLAALLDHALKDSHVLAAVLRQERVRGVELNQATVVEYEQPVVIDNGRQAVR